MSKNLLIVGAGVYGLVAKEIAQSMGCFERIAFVDDHAKIASDQSEVLCRVADVERLAGEYDSVVVAIGNPKVRLELIRTLGELPVFRVATLISPRAYVSPSARVGVGCIIEPMAVVHAGCVLEAGCLVCAGAVVNHASVCREGVQVDCNATVEGYCTVPEGRKIHSGEVYGRETGKN